MLWLLDDREVRQQMIQENQAPSVAMSSSVLAFHREIIMSFMPIYSKFSFVYAALFTNFAHHNAI